MTELLGGEGGVAAQPIRRETEQVGGHPRIEDVYLGAADRAAAGILPHRQPPQDEYGLQEPGVVLGGAGLDACITARLGHVEGLPGLGGQPLQKVGKGLGLVHPQQLAGVHLDRQPEVLLDHPPALPVVAAVDLHREPPCNNPRRIVFPAAAAGGTERLRTVEHIFDEVAPRPGCLGLRQGQNRQPEQPARQRLDAPGQSLVTGRPGQHEPAGGPIVVEPGLYVVEYLRHLLVFVDEHRAGSGDRRVGVGPGLRPGARMVEIDDSPAKTPGYLF